MTSKKFIVMIVVVLVVVFIYAQTDIESFLNIKGVKILIENSTIENIEQLDNNMQVTINGKVINLERTQEKYVTVTKEECNKLGFVVLPGYGYAFINETNEFTQHNGWVLGIAYSKNDGFSSSLQEMVEFVNTAHSYNLRPVVRVLGNKWHEELMPASQVIDFINALEQETGKEFYVQIWDKPNVNFGQEITAEEYADYVTEVADDTDVKIISASLSIGSGNINYNRTPAEEYFEELLLIPEFWNSIDYWGSTLYNPNISGSDCINVTEIEFYGDQIVCRNTNYNYRYELEKIKQETRKQYEVFLTEVGYPKPEDRTYDLINLLEQVKADPHVVSGTIFVANGWDTWQSSSWLNENKTFKSFVAELLSLCAE